MVLRSLTTAATALAVALALASGASAAPADLDAGFGAGGLFTTALSGSQVIDALQIEGDGKIVFAGSQYDPLATPKYVGFVGRLNAGGTLDTSFGGTGIVTYTDGTNDTRFSSVGVDGLGRIVAGGYVSGSPDVGILARYNSNGTPDTSFNTTGQRTQMGSSGFVISGIAVQPDGSVIAGGNTASGNAVFMIWKVNEDGSNATGFAGDPNGYATFPFFGDGDEAGPMASYPGGGFALVGDIKNGTGPNVDVFGVRKFTSGGLPDGSFEATGRTIVPIGTGETAFPSCAVALADGGVLVGGAISPPTAGGFLYALGRLKASGDRDQNFGSDGKVVVDQGGYDGVGGCAVQPDGKIVLTAFDAGSDRGFDFVRLNSNGSLDTTFGNGGKSSFVPGGGEAISSALALRPNGRIGAGGSVSLPGGTTDNDAAVLQLIGGDAATPPLPPFPGSKITSPSRSKLKAKKFNKIAGTAGPAGSIAKVEVAIRRIDKTQLKKKRCLWVKSSKGALKKVKSSSKKKCTKQVWLKASGTASWSYKLKKALKPGSYEIYSRTTLTTGATQVAFTKKSGNFRTLKLTR